MIEIRWVNDGDNLELQQRTRGLTVDVSGAFCGFTEWSDWSAIPGVHADDVDRTTESGIAVGDHRIEYHKPDLTLAYSALAPKVSEAWALLRCGNIEEAKKAMESAQAVIDTAAMTSAPIRF